MKLKSKMSNEENFPGLNKRHGFFKVIERNQKDRDDYHQKKEQVKEVRLQDTRVKKRAARQPPRELYRPPPVRGQRKSENKDPVYCLEIEVEPGRWHRQVVDEVGCVKEISRSICQQFRMDEIQKKAIVEMMTEFEKKLIL